jgi:hypothetical protein
MFRATVYDAGRKTVTGNRVGCSSRHDFNAVPVLKKESKFDLPSGKLCLVMTIDEADRDRFRRLGSALECWNFRTGLTVGSQFKGMEFR